MIYIISILLAGILLVLIGIYQNRDELKKPKETKKNLVLHFKNNPCAFDYASEYLSLNLGYEMLYVGIIEGAETKGNTQQAILRIAANGGEVIVFGFTNSKKANLSKGNLVLWGLMDLVDFDNNKDVMAAGQILALIAPSYDVATSKWEIKTDLTK
ncbi:hypothetical protein [Acinetobacter sp. YH1901134]|uniref:hypothetical protein n=1 Tax=Acinetobacter sp. YH1901134 TaxID=2601199 RepID=UPI0015D2152B|nr:hypothetical protein [Acinetobacter sp. YH1901134]